MLVAAADAIASLIPEAELSRDRIIPRVLDLRVGPAVAEAVANAAVALGVAQADVEPEAVGDRTRQLVYEGESALHEVSYRSVERTLGDEALELHRRYRGTIEVASKVPLKDERALGLIATPGVAYPVREILRHPETVWDYTTKGNLIAVVTDGSALLGRGGFGAEAALPAMEGKCVLYKTLAGVDAFPLCLAVQDVDQFVSMVKAIEPSVGAVNLEDIAAPQCFAIEKRLREEIEIPVFHDDQHGTAVIVLAALLNALRLTKRSLEGVQIALSGAGAAGIAVARMLAEAGAGDVIVCDRRGILREGRAEMNAEKDAIARSTNRNRITGGLGDAMRGSEVFIGVSGPNLVSTEMIRSMAQRPIVFALAAPIPEIMPDAALVAGAAVVGTSRRHGPNPFQNAIAFPGIMRGALDVVARDINGAMRIAAARALADLVPEYAPRRPA
jgi:malate dehydrogenase (oxaloacetate-decarboxylating)